MAPDDSPFGRLAHAADPTASPGAALGGTVEMDSMVTQCLATSMAYSASKCSFVASE